MESLKLMKNKIISLFLISLFVLLTSVTVNADTKVVVIPLLGGDTASISNDTARISNIVTVAKSGGDFTDPVAAMKSITDASFTNPYIIFIAPGTYTISETLQVKNNVNLIGAGKEITTITVPVSSDVNTTINVELGGGLNGPIIENLTIQNIRNGSSCIGIRTRSIILRNSIVEVRGCTSFSTGIIDFFIADIEGSNIIVSGGNTAIGVMADSFGGPFVLTNSKINVIGGNSTAARVTQADIKRSSLVVDTVNFSGGTDNLIGIDLEFFGGATEASVVNSDISINPLARGVGSAIGVNAVGETRVSVRGSRVESTNTALSSEGDSPITVSQSTIIGGTVGNEITCVASDNGAGLELDNNCDILTLGPS